MPRTKNNYERNEEMDYLALSRCSFDDSDHFTRLATSAFHLI